MKIVHLTAGAGPMYCGSCLHGTTLATALRGLGADVVLVPVYTPLRTDEPSASCERLAMGGVNVYLQEQSALFRHTPGFIDWLLDRPGLVRWAARRGGTRPESLGASTVSVLRGEEGRQRKEVEKVVRWLQAEARPDVVHLSNILLAGLAGPLRRRLGVLVVCTLSGEDGFLARLPSPFREQSHALLRQQAAELDALIATSRYYADFMAEYLDVARERIRVIPPGLNLDGYPEGGRGKGEGGRPDTELRTIGYLGRICPEKGVHLLVEALRLLSQEPDLPPVRCRAAGYLDPADKPYLDEIQERAAAWGLGGRFQYLGELDRAGKIAFLQSLDVMSAPSVRPESKGLPVLEAWAAGVPVVLPAHGAFVELVEDTGGGLLCEPGNAAALAASLGRMLREPELAAECGRRGQQAVRDRYHAGRMARQTLELYHELGSVTPQ